MFLSIAQKATHLLNNITGDRHQNIGSDLLYESLRVVTYHCTSSAHRFYQSYFTVEVSSETVFDTEHAV